VAQVPSKHKALSSNPRIDEIKNKEKKEKVLKQHTAMIPH
jgi:hypothetical protein